MASGSHVADSGFIGRPDSSEAAPYYFTYIDKVPAGDIKAVLKKQLTDITTFLETISEEKSLSRYAQGKWSIRGVLNHINDTERVFAFRAMWFARKLGIPLPSFDQDVAVKHSAADAVRWSDHIEEFRQVRLATISLFENLEGEAWMRTGTASEKPFSVRAMAYIIAGHAEHHVIGIRENYL
ncbi:MAG: DinB family protein [Acidobacteriaceae bacterium]